jgi:ParB-like chromosome segregation protein Spo0J
MSNRKPKPTDTPAIHCQHTRLEPIENLREHPKNPNAHSDTQVALLAKNIRHLGWRHPILVSGLTGFIVAGHARLQAARVLNLAAVPVDVQDFETQADEMAYLLADNKIAELADRQTGMIKDLLQELDDGATDMDLTGFDASELERLMTQYHVPDGNKPIDEDAMTQTENECPKCGFKW